MKSDAESACSGSHGMSPFNDTLTYCMGQANAAAVSVYSCTYIIGHSYILDFSDTTNSKFGLWLGDG